MDADTITKEAQLRMVYSRYGISFKRPKFYRFCSPEGEFRVLALVKLWPLIKFEAAAPTKALATEQVAAKILSDIRTLVFLESYFTLVHMEITDPTPKPYDYKDHSNIDGSDSTSINSSLLLKCMQLGMPNPQTHAHYYGPIIGWMVTAIVAQFKVTVVGTNRKQSRRVADKLLYDSLLGNVHSSIQKLHVPTLLVDDDQVLQNPLLDVCQSAYSSFRENPLTSQVKLFQVREGMKRVTKIDALNVLLDDSNVVSQVTADSNDSAKQPPEKESMSEEKDHEKEAVQTVVAESNIEIREEKDTQTTPQLPCARAHSYHMTPKHLETKWHVLVDYENVSWIKNVPFPPWCVVHSFQSIYHRNTPIPYAVQHGISVQCKDAADHKMTFTAGMLTMRGVRRFVVVTGDRFYKALIACLRDEKCDVALCRDQRELSVFLDTQLTSSAWYANY